MSFILCPIKKRRIGEIIPGIGGMWKLAHKSTLKQGHCMFLVIEMMFWLVILLSLLPCAFLLLSPAVPCVLQIPSHNTCLLRWSRVRFHWRRAVSQVLTRSRRCPHRRWNQGRLQALPGNPDSELTRLVPCQPGPSSFGLVRKKKIWF